MEQTPVVTCFLRNRGEVFLGRRSDDVGSYRGAWAAVSGHVEGDPEATARQEIEEETGLTDDVSLRRRGDPFEVVDERQSKRWVVHPFLFESETRAIDPNWEIEEFEWVHPTALRRRETVPDLWTSYDRVRPSVETVADDREHGAAWLSLRALEVLRDDAGTMAWGEREDGWQSLVETAQALRTARPSMPVVSNRINRVMARATKTPESVEPTAREAIEESVEADAGAAAVAADRLPDRIATLSRSGTVLEAIERAEPDAVLIAESRPGREGIGVAETLADSTDVTLVGDAGLPWAIHDWRPEAVVVGADAIGPDGTLINKVGTRSAALSAAHEGINCLVVAAADKISPDDDLDLEQADPATIADGSTAITVDAPLFDETPADLVTGICTDQGILGTAEVRNIAAEHRSNANWSE